MLDVTRCGSVANSISMCTYLILVAKKKQLNWQHRTTRVYLHRQLQGSPEKKKPSEREGEGFFFLGYPILVRHLSNTIVCWAKNTLFQRFGIGTLVALMPNLVL